MCCCLLESSLQSLCGLVSYSLSLSLCFPDTITIPFTNTTTITITITTTITINFTSVESIALTIPKVKHWDV
jgi:hypothetical protein